MCSTSEILPRIDTWAALEPKLIAGGVLTVTQIPYSGSLSSARLLHQGQRWEVNVKLWRRLQHLGRYETIADSETAGARRFSVRWRESPSTPPSAR